VKLVNPDRRKILTATGRGVVASMLGSALSVASKDSKALSIRTLRWGFVGTGSIAGWMAAAIKDADGAKLAAVSSRRMDSAREFADTHKIENAFDSWAEMIASDYVDAIYVATPTSVREEICTAAAQHGKHVLGEKPFASLPSLQRITAACRENGVGFMDATHFVHLPRTADIKATMQDTVGWPWSLDTAFQFEMADTGNIRYNPKLEPLGAIGDAGWYNMRAAVEYLSQNIEIQSVDAYLRRDKETGAAIAGSGVIRFDDESTTTWNCGFDSGGVNMDLRISGANGVIRLDDFLSTGPNGISEFTLHKGGFSNGSVEVVKSSPSKAGPTLMFEDYVAMLQDKQKFEQSVRSSERTQYLLDAVWASGLQNESA
jgi:predicted dehydrogenase